jgi:hypothetical protein
MIDAQVETRVRGSNLNGPARFSRTVEVDLNRTVFEAMSAAEVSAHLKLAGVDPQPTIEAVKALVQLELRKRRR